MEGQHPGIIPDERDRPLGELARERPVCMPADIGQIGPDATAERTRRAKAAPEALDPTGRAGEAGRVEQVTGSGTSKAVFDPLAGGSVGRAEQEIDAGPDGGDDVDDLTVALGEGRHVEGVGQGDTAEPELAAQETAHHDRRQGGRQVVPPGDGGQGDVAGHDHVEAAGDRRAIRCQLDRIEPGSILGHRRQLVVGVDGDVAEPGEVLARRGDTGRVEPANERRPETPDLDRIVAERADADGRVRRVGRDVEDRRVGEAHAHRPQLGADRPTDTPSEIRVPDRAEGHVAGERRRAVAEGHELATLLVGRDEERWGLRIPSPRRRLEGVGELAHLARRGDVGEPEEGDPRGRLAGQPVGHPGGQPLALEGDHESPEDGARMSRCASGGHPFTAPASPRTK